MVLLDPKLQLLVELDYKYSEVYKTHVNQSVKFYYNLKKILLKR